MKKTASFKDFLVFAIWFLAIFGLSYAGLYALGFIPKEIDPNSRDTIIDSFRQDAFNAVTGDDGTQYTEPGDLPVHITIPGTNVNIKVQNPDTTDPVLLDEYLKKGVVRYPGSGLLGSGNVLLFGHSSHLKVVQNQAYKALNGIENLKTGDEIYVDSEGFRYVYKTKSVRMAPASEIKVDFSNKENMVTIATCNNFGAKEDRHVVEAVFDRKETIALP